MYSAQEKPQRGTIVAVDPGKMKDDGTRADVDVKVGDTVASQDNLLILE